MELDALQRLFARDIEAVRAQIRVYPDDESPWSVPPGIVNSGGTLVLHLMGNLQHFIGAQLGDSGYVRDRPAEFATRGLSRAALDALVVECGDAVQAALERLDEARLDDAYPQEIGGVQLSVRLFVFHLLTHLSYHLGQIDYHRRLVTGDARSAGASSIKALAR